MFVATRAMAMAASIVTQVCQGLDVTARAAVPEAASSRILALSSSESASKSDGGIFIGQLAHHGQVEVEQVGIGGSGHHEVSGPGQEIVRVVLREGGNRVGAASAGPGGTVPVHHGPRRVGRSVGAI